MQQRIIRIYVMNVFSVLIVIYASVTHMFYAATETGDDLNHYHYKVANPTLPYSEFDCVEDETAMQITNTVFTGIVIKVFTILATYILSVVVKGQILRQSPKKWKQDFSVPKETV